MLLSQIPIGMAYTIELIGVMSPKEISIGENVWIGERSLILKGSKIGTSRLLVQVQLLLENSPNQFMQAIQLSSLELNEQEFITRESLFENLNH